MRSSAWWVRRLFNEVLNYADITALSKSQSTANVALSDAKAYTDSKVSPWIEIKYSDLYSLVDKKKLVAGQKYRIIDYETTISETDARSVGYLFDILVTAISESELSEMAEALPTKRDGAYPHPIKGWQIWYILNNYKYELFKGSTTGTITRMIDDQGNDAPYDFKNIQFKRKHTEGKFEESSTTESYFFTYSCYNYGDIEDASSPGSSQVRCVDNVIGNSSWNNVFMTKFNSARALVSHISIGSGCSGNTLMCSNDTRIQVVKFGRNCNNNTFSQLDGRLIMGDQCNSNIGYFDLPYGARYHYIEMANGCSGNQFGKNNDYVAILGASCANNSIDGYCRLEEGCYNNTIKGAVLKSLGEDCHDNILEGYSVVMGEGCYNIQHYKGDLTLGSGCYEMVLQKNGSADGVIILGNNCGHITAKGYMRGGSYLTNIVCDGKFEFGNYCNDIQIIGGYYSYATGKEQNFMCEVGNCCTEIHIDTECDNVRIGSYSSHITSASSSKHICNLIIKDFVRHINLTEFSDTSTSDYYTIIDSSVKGTEEAIIDIPVTNGKDVTYVKDSSGVIKSFIAGDFANLTTI